MKEVVTNPQQSDMGSGFGYVDGVGGYSLREVLEFYSKNSKTWGVICIYRNDSIIRKFDYDTYSSNKVFYHHLSWEYSLAVKEVKFNYCFMYKNIDIYLE